MDLIVVPFFIGSGTHVQRDIRERLGIACEDGGSGSAGRRIVVDRPVGEDPAIEDLIVSLAARD